MRFKRTQKVMSLVLSVCLLMSMAVTAGASASAEIASDRLESIASRAKATVARLNSYGVDKNETVKAIITLSGKSMLDKELAGESVNDSNKARYSARNQQKTLMRKMSSSFDYELLYNYSAIFNGIAISTKFSNLEKIAEMDNVTGVYLANTYSVPDYEVMPQAEYSSQTMGVNSLRDKGYDGDGIVISVLDTGLRTTHEAFQDYGIMDTVTLTKEKVDSIDTYYKGEWLSDKVPFAYDYADKDDDVTPPDEHGTHVSGIACGYAEESDGAVVFTGEAPAAQLLSMKIFSSADGAGGTDSTIYFAALEDSYLLKADVINMSIGKPGGFTYDKELENVVFGNVYEKLNKAGVVTCVAAGNEYSMAYNSYSPVEGMVPTSYTDYGTVGSPSTFRENVSIAAVENVRYPAYMIEAHGEGFTYIDSSLDGSFRGEFGGETFTYVVIPGVGKTEDFAAVEDVIPSRGEWIAVVQRGEIDFQTKLENSYLAGADGMVCYNNAEGEISMAIDNFYLPCASITMESGKILVDNAVDSLGELTVNEEMVVIDNEKANEMTDFSGWGTTSDLAFKPQIAAPGGNIHAAGPGADDEYIVISGTSMACPNAAGVFACLLQYLREEHPDFKKKDTAEYAKKLLFSTANILENPNADDVAYSPRKQGAGIMNVENAVEAASYIENSLIELGDDAKRTGEYNFDFEVTGLDSTTKTYELDAIVLTDKAVYSEDVGAWYNSLTSLDMLDEGFAEVSFSDDTLTIKGTETKKVSVTVELTEAGIEEFEEKFENGAFVEGYIILRNDDSSDIHASFMGYYGNWLDVPVMDTLNYSDVIDIDYMVHTEPVDEEGHTYAEYGYSYADFLYGECVAGFNQAYLYSTSLYQDPTTGMTSEYGPVGYIGDNIFDYVTFDEDHMAISHKGSVHAFADQILLYPMQIRCTAHTIMVISDAETDEVYYVDDTPYLTKAYESEGSYYAAGYFMWDGKNTYTEDSMSYNDYVENGTKVNVQFFGWLDYDKDAQEEFEEIDGDYAQLLTSAWSDRELWSLKDVLVDTQAPRMDSLSYNSKNGELSFELSDNHYLAYMGICDENGNYAYEVNPGTDKGETFADEFNLSEAFSGKIPEVFYIEASDYALNYPAQEIIYADGVIAIDDYVVQAFDEEGNLIDESNVTFECDGEVYEYGEPLEVGETFEIYVNGEYSGKDIEIECFGPNSVRFGNTKEYVTVFSTLGDNHEYYTPDGDLTIVSEDDEVEMEEEEVGMFSAMAFPGNYEVYIDGEATGIEIVVGENEDNHAFLYFYTLSFDDNTTKYECDVPDEEIYLSGAEITLDIDDPECEEYTFKSWNTMASGKGDSYDGKDTFTMPEADTVLYAIWVGSRQIDDELIGDVNCDGEINMNDVTTLQRIIAELDKYADYGDLSETNADADGNGKISMTDVTQIQKYKAGIVTVLG